MFEKSQFFIILIILLIVLYYSKCEWLDPTNLFKSTDFFSTVENPEQSKQTLDLNLLPKPQIINPGKRIAFVYLYTPNISDYASHSIKNLTNYVISKGYTLIIYDQILDSNVYPCWNKILAILANLKNYDYIVWFDADAIISNPNKRIEDYVNLQPDKDLLICFDCVKDKECVNSGIMIIANTKWSYDLFERTWNNPTPHNHNDQNILYMEILKQSYPNITPKIKYPEICHELVHPKVYVFPENYFNSHITNYLRDDFIIHLMGLDSISRINIMRQINTKLGLDNYNNDDCVKKIQELGLPEYYGKQFKTEEIEKICYTGRKI